MTESRVGFVGLGQMGSRMAMRLIAAGYSMTVYNRTVARAEPLIDGGASVASSAQELAGVSDVVLLSLANDAALVEVMRGSGGVLAGLREGVTVIDFSTVSPHISRGVALEVEAKNCAMLDAPVSGSTPQAEGGALNILVGGDEDVYQRSRSILDVLGKSFYLGPNGMGLAMKLVVNALLGLGVQALAEAISLGEAAGVDKNRLLDVLRQMAVVSPAQSSKLENVRTGQYPSAFSLQNMNKDYALIADLASRSSVPMPATAAAQQMSRAAQAKGIQEDFSVVIRLMEQLAGGISPVSRP